VPTYRRHPLVDEIWTLGRGAVRPRVFREPFGCKIDDRVGCGKNRLRRAIVPLQRNDFGLWAKVARKVEDVAHGCSPKRIDRRTSYAFAIVSAAAGLRIEAGVIAQARIALGGVALKPWRAREAEQILIGARADASVFRRTAEAALADPALPGSPFAAVSGGLAHV
jgi:hypothetical protein